MGPYRFFRVLISSYGGSLWVLMCPYKFWSFEVLMGPYVSILVYIGP